MADEKGAEAIRDKNRRIREEAAAKRRSKREAEKVVARRPTLGQLEASEIMDDAFARTTHAVTGWVRRNFTVLQWVIIVVVAGGIGWQVYVHHRDKVEGRTTDALAVGLNQEFARVGEPSEEDPMTGLGDTRPVHKEHTERLKAAEGAYRKVSEGDTIQKLARLGLAGILFDEGKYKEALAEYKALKDTSLTKDDADIRGRVIEGIGLSQEALGDLAGAKKSYQELVNHDSPQFSALGLYQQARLELKEGAKDKAKEHLKAGLKKLGDAKVRQAYIDGVSRELLASIDPSAVPPPSLDMLPPEQREQLKAIEEMKKAAEKAKKAAADAAQNLPPQDMSPEQLKKLLEGVNTNLPQLPPSAVPASSAP